MSRAIPKRCSSVCRFIHARVSALSAVTERNSPQAQGQNSVIQEQPFDGRCSLMVHVNLLLVGIIGHFWTSRRLGSLRGLQRHGSRQHEASAPLATVCSSLPKELDEEVAELHFQVLGRSFYLLVFTWISPGVQSAGSLGTKIRAGSSSNGYWWTLLALAESSRTPASVAWGARIRESARRPGSLERHPPRLFGICSRNVAARKTSPLGWRLLVCLSAVLPSS